MGGVGSDVRSGYAWAPASFGGASVGLSVAKLRPPKGKAVTSHHNHAVTTTAVSPCLFAGYFHLTSCRRPGAAPTAVLPSAPRVGQMSGESVTEPGAEFVCANLFRAGQASKVAAAAAVVVVAAAAAVMVLVVYLLPVGSGGGSSGGGVGGVLISLSPLPSLFWSWGIGMVRP